MKMYRNTTPYKKVSNTDNTIYIRSAVLFNSDTSGLISDASGIHEQRIFNPCAVKLLPFPAKTSITVYMKLEPCREAHTKNKTQILNVMQRETQNLFYRSSVSVET